MTFRRVFTRLILALAMILPSLPFVFVTGPVLAAARNADGLQHYEQALEAFEDGKFKVAVIHLKNALQSDPRDVSANLLLGRTYVKMGNGAAAERVLLKARAFGADERRVLIALGRAYLLQQKFHEVIEQIRDVGGDRKLQFDLLSLRGEAYLGLGDLDDAEKTFIEAESLRNPDSDGYATPTLGRVSILLRRGDLEGALDLTRPLAQSAQADANVWLALGEIRRLKRQFRLAIARYSKAIKINAKPLPARIGRAATLMDLGDDKNALVDLEYLRGEAPDNPRIAFLYAMALARTGNLAAARDVLSDSAAMLSRLKGKRIMNDPAAQLLAGLVHYANNSLNEARAFFERHVKRVPDSIIARTLLGDLNLRLSKPDDAVRVLEPGLADAPDNIHLNLLLATAYSRLGKHDRAMALLQKAAELAPDHATVRTQLALNQLSLGRRDTAIAGLKGVVDHSPDNVQAAAVLTLLYLNERKFGEALRIAQSIARQQPGNPIGHNLVGAAHEGLGNRDTARSSFKRALNSDANHAATYLNLARLDALEGRMDSARQWYQALLKRETENLSAYIGLSRLAEKEGRIDDAVRWLQKAHTLGKKSLLPRLHLVELYFRTEQIGEARKIAKLLNDMNPTDLRAIEALGLVEAKEGRFDMARAAYRRMAQTAGSAKWLIRTGNRQLQVKDIEGARHSLTRALDLDPDALVAGEMLVKVDVATGRLDKAMAVADDIRTRYPKRPIGDILVGDVYMRRGMYEAAVRAYDAAESKGSTSGIAQRLFVARRQSGARETATRALEDWIAKHPDDLAARRILAAGHMEDGNDRIALDQHQALAKLAPNDPVIHNNLAVLYQRSGDARALKHAETADRLAPHHPRILDTYGWILVQHGNTRRGLRLLREAEDRGNTSPDLKFHLAAALHQLGKTAEARRKLKAALGAGAKFPGIDEARALLDRIGER